MPIPDFQTLMRPFLQLLSDRKPRHINDILEHLSNEYNLTPDERQSMLPSGTDFTMRNRVGWTRTYLKKAGLIDSPSRAMFAINDTGLDVLKNAKTINVAFLRTLPAFQEWQKTYASKEAIAPVDGGPTIGTPSGTVSEQTPTELMQTAYGQWHDSITFDLLQKIKSLKPREFEILVIKLLRAMGYGYETELGHTGQSGDGGVDGIIKEDKLGLDNIYIQAKLYENTVPIGHLRDFIGALASRKASKGVFITSSNFPSSADAFLAPVPTRVVLITGKELAELMIQYNVGVAVKETFVLKGISDEFFEEELG